MKKTLLVSAIVLSFLASCKKSSSDTENGGGNCPVVVKKESLSTTGGQTIYVTVTFRYNNGQTFSKNYSEAASDSYRTGMTVCNP